MAILEQADQTGYLQTHKIELIFGVRTAEDIFYLSELRRMAVAHPENLLLTIALSDAENDRDTSIGVLITDCEFEVDRIRYDKFA